MKTIVSMKTKELKPIAYINTYLFLDPQLEETYNALHWVLGLQLVQGTTLLDQQPHTALSIMVFTSLFTMCNPPKIDIIHCNCQGVSWFRNSYLFVNFAVGFFLTVTRLSCGEEQNNPVLTINMYVLTITLIPR